MLAPGEPDDPLQFIDVRDLAGWLVAAAASGSAAASGPASAQAEPTAGFSGIFNVTGLPIRFVDFLSHCAAPGVDAELVWIASDRLLGAGLDPWMGVPLWITGSGWEAANAVDVSRQSPWVSGTGRSARPSKERSRSRVALDRCRSRLISKRISCAGSDTP